MGNSQSIPFPSYGILEEFYSKTFEEAYPSFANDPFAKAYLNEVDDEINPDWWYWRGFIAWWFVISILCPYHRQKKTEKEEE